MADPINYNDIRFDAQGRPFWLTQSGKVSYMPPAAAAQSSNARAIQWAASQGEVYPRDAAGHIIGPPTHTAAPGNTFSRQNNGWNPDKGQFDTGMNWSGLGGAILGGSALGGIGAASALAGAGGAAGAASGGGAGLAADGTIPFSTAPGVAAAAGSGAVAPAAGLGASAPLGSLTAAGGTAAGAGAAGATGAKSLLGNLTSPNNLAGLAGLITSLAGGSGGGSNGGVSPEMAQAQAITNARMRRADPLHQMAVNLAASRMPTNMQLPVPNVPLPPER